MSVAREAATAARGRPAETRPGGAEQLRKALAVAAEYLPEARRGELRRVLLDLTGYPCFWPDTSLSPEGNLRAQLARAAAALGAGARLRDLAAAFDEDLRAARGGRLGEP